MEGHFEQPELMSNNLRQKLLQFGAPMDLLDRFMQKGADYA